MSELLTGDPTVEETQKSALRKLFSLERLWITGLALLCAGIVSASIAYLPQLAHNMQMQKTAEIQFDIGAELVRRTASDPATEFPTCSAMGAFVIVHVSGNDYVGQMRYEYTAQDADTCTYSNDGDCDEPSLCARGTDTTDCRSTPPTVTEHFTCKFDITADTQAWNLGFQATSDCLLGSNQRVRNACY